MHTQANTGRQAESGKAARAEKFFLHRSPCRPERVLTETALIFYFLPAPPSKTLPNPARASLL